MAPLPPTPAQALRSFKLTITVEPKYHPKIIGRKGAIITNIRTEHDVNIQFPEKSDESQVRPSAGGGGAPVHHTMGSPGVTCSVCLSTGPDYDHRV